MRQRLLLFALGVGVLLGVPALAQGITVHAEWRAKLHGSVAYSAVGGAADYSRAGSSERGINVTVWHARRLAGRRLTVYLAGTLVGRMRVSSTGRAHLYRDTANGQNVPELSPRHHRITVRTRGGVLVASGRLRLVRPPA